MTKDRIPTPVPTRNQSLVKCSCGKEVPAIEFFDPFLNKLTKKCRKCRGNSQSLLRKISSREKIEEY